MSGVHLIAVDEQKVYTVNADAGVVVPEDGQSYSVSQAIYAAVFSQLENLDGARLESWGLLSGTYLRMYEDRGSRDKGSSS